MAKGVCRVAVLGLDHHYSALLFMPAFAADDRIEIAGIADDDLDRARAVASDYAVERVEREPRAFLDDPSVDVVAVFSSTDRNPGLCIAAAEAGKHVLAIKPIARTLPEATDVVHAVRKAGVCLLPAEGAGPSGRRGTVEAAREVVTSGRIGDPTFARCSISAGLPQRWPGDPDPGWFVDPAKCAGGGWIDHAVYEIDRLRWIFGREIETIGGAIANLCHPQLQLEDWGSALAQFDGTLPAELRCDWFMASTAMYQSEWEIAGTKGVVRIDDVAGTVRVAPVPPPGAPMSGWEDVSVPQNGDARAAAAHLAAVVLDGAPPLATVEDAWRNLAAARAFYDAARTGTRVAVEHEVPEL